ncbi:hypothetical protein [Nocardioides coralli]|uniref:hypothetical protein n=1 Tax=Nocardioides coralli TaxID=2872154 RepID=UPI001CA427F0|nr:hypothetical protein [Nocardioides coralli]QZY29600.1 hypothetical protein K6T13_02595 [Nocardioides coralli]
MTTLTTHPRTDSAPPAPARRSLAVRRACLVAAPALGGLLAVVGAVADPAAGVSGREMWQIYADNPEPLQFKSLGFKWSYALWMAPAMLLAPLIRSRGAALATLAAVIGFLGMTTLPGLLFVDWYDSAVGQHFGVDGTEAVNDTMGAMWGVPYFTLPGIIGLFLALPLAMLAAWRAGLTRWWGLVAAVLAIAVFLGSGVTVWGAVGTAVCLAVVSVALAQGTRVHARD